MTPPDAASHSSVSPARRAGGVLLWLVLIPVWFFALWAAGVVACLFIELWFDLPQDNRGLEYGAAAAAVLIQLSLFGPLILKRRTLKGLLVLALAAWIASIGYSIHFRAAPWTEFIGSSREQVEKIFSSSPNPPPFLFAVGDETRSVYMVTADRPVVFTIERNDQDPIWFGAIAPEAGSGRFILKVEAQGSGGLSLPAFTTAPLVDDEWRDYLIPSTDLPPSLRSLVVKVWSDDPQSAPRALVSAPRALRPRERPNVVMVMVDTFRMDQVNPATAPFLSAFMNQSTVFAQAMSPSSWTVPSTASIMTGVYPHQHGYISNAHMKFNPGVELISTQFKNAGYRTAAVTANVLIDPRYGFAKDFDQFIALGRTQRAWWNTGRMVTMRAGDWIERNDQAPFFLYLHYMDLHFPYFAPPPDTFGDLKGGLPDRLLSFYDFFRYDFQDFTVEWPETHPESIARILPRYRGEIRYWDRQFEELIHLLDERGLLANTIVVVIGDHGEGFGEHGNFRHGSTLYQEETHVPMIVFDGRRREGRVVTTPASTIEVDTIVADLTGVKPGESWKGRVLSGFTASLPEPRRIASLLSYRHFHVMTGEPEAVKVALAARQGPEKVILQYDSLTGDYIYHLFNLARDPGEQNNLWDQSLRTDLPLYKWMTDFLPDPKSIIFAIPEDGYRQKEDDLRALGYIQDRPKPSPKQPPPPEQP